MTSKIIYNPYRYTLYLSRSGELLPASDVRINEDALANASLDHHIQNSFNYIPDPEIYLPVVADFKPIPPRSVWSIDGERISPHLSKKRGAGVILNIETNLLRYEKMLRNEGIALEMSGGLDTGLIYGALKSMGFSPVLIGVVSDRYEFRTESLIQRKLMSAERSIILDEMGTFPFFDIKNTPFHVIPDKTSLFYGFFLKTRENLPHDTQVLLNGVAGDALLAQSIVIPSSYWMLNEWWAREHIYLPAGIDYLSAYSLYGIRRYLEVQRLGMGEDSQKLWARNRFAQILPRELSAYSYKAGHDGVFYEGLQASFTDILEVCRFAYSINKDKRLAPGNVDKVISNWRNYQHRDLVTMLAVVSFAVWIWVNCR